MIGTPTLVKSVTYDDTGNITNKSDLADGSGGTGTYTYPNPGNPLPHAVKSISGTANGTRVGKASSRAVLSFPSKTIPPATSSAAPAVAVGTNGQALPIS